MGNSRLPRFVFYSETFLHRSEQFLHAQLAGVKRAAVEVAARWGANLSEFPVENLFLVEEYRRLFPRLWSALVRKLFNRNVPRWMLPGYAIRRLAAHVRRNPPDLAYCLFGWHAAQLLEILRAADSKAPLVYFAGGTDVTAARWYGTEYLASLGKVWDRAAMILTGSEFLKNRLLDLAAPLNKIRVHYIGVHVPKPGKNDGRDRSKDTFRILAVSRLSPVKGVSHTIRSFALTAKQMPDAILTIVGDGEEWETCSRLASDLGLADRIQFRGSVPHRQVYEYMAGADLFVQHNVRTPEGAEESVAGTLSEASAHALPVIGTRSGGVPEAVIDGKTGILVEPGDEKGMAEAIMLLYRNPDLRIQLGKAGRALVEEKFNLDKQNRILEKLLFEAAGLKYPE